MKRTKTSQRGVTLVEIAIVLVIIGLLLGGILKGQELINNAKVRAIADRQNSLKVAWFAFIDRYQALPGDYLKAQQNVPGAGVIDPTTTQDGIGGGDGVIVEFESPYVFQHLTGAGYLRCPQCTYADPAFTPVNPDATNSLQNQYGGVMAIFVDGGSAVLNSDIGSDTYMFDSAVGNRSPRLMIHSGQNIPSNIMAEVDRKLDDGSPQYGDLRASTYAATGLAPTGACIDQDAEGDAVQVDSDVLYETADALTGWRFASAPPEANCGSVVTI